MPESERFENPSCKRAQRTFHVVINDNTQDRNHHGVYRVETTAMGTTLNSAFKLLRPSLSQLKMHNFDLDALLSWIRRDLEALGLRYMSNVHTRETTDVDVVASVAFLEQIISLMPAVRHVRLLHINLYNSMTSEMAKQDVRI